MARPRSYETAAERQAAYRERLRNAQNPEGVTEEPVTEGPVTEPEEEPVTEEEGGTPEPEAAQPFEPSLRSLEALIAHGRAGGQLTAAEEQRIRDHFGYASSETRTLAERDAAAQRITGKPALTEEEYVRLMMSDSRLLNRRRAERYARWRYREFVRGEVASL